MANVVGISSVVLQLAASVTLHLIHVLALKVPVGVTQLPGFFLALTS